MHNFGLVQANVWANNEIAHLEPDPNFLHKNVVTRRRIDLWFHSTTKYGPNQTRKKSLNGITIKKIEDQDRMRAFHGQGIVEEQESDKGQSVD